MKKLLLVGAGLAAVFAFAAVVRAQNIDDVGGNIFDAVSIDVKVNGSDGPVEVAAGSRIVVSWVSDGAFRCRGNWSRQDIKPTGSVAGRISRSVTIKAACIDREGNRDDDFVVVNVTGKEQIAVPAPTTSTTPPPAAGPAASITVIAPKGGEEYRVGETVTVQWTSQGLPVNLPGASDYLPIKIDLMVAGEGGLRATLADNIPNNGLYKVDIPAHGIVRSGDSEKFYLTVVVDPFALVNIKQKTGFNTDSVPRPIGRSKNFTITAPASAQPSVDLKVNGSDGPITVRQNETIRFSWTSSGAYRCDGEQGMDSLSGSFSVLATTTGKHVFRIGCFGEGGGSPSNVLVGRDSVVVEVTPAAQPSVNLKINDVEGPITIRQNETIRLTWTSQNANECRGSQRMQGTSGSIGVTASSTGSHTFWVSCVNDTGGYAQDTVKVEVTAAGSITVTSPNGGENYKAGDKINVTWTTKEISGDDDILIRIARGDTVVYTFPKTVNNGIETVTLPTSLPVANDYRIEVIRATGEPYFDRSDKPFSIAAPSSTTSTSGTTSSGNVGAGNVGTASAAPANLVPSAPTISGTRTAAGDKLYAGSMSLTATIQNTGGPLTSSVSARFQYSTNNANWYDFQEVGPITTTPKNVSHSWTGGVGNFYFRLCIGNGTDNCSSPTYIEIVPTEGAFLGLSQYAGAGVPSVPTAGVFDFLKAFFGR